MVDESVGQGHGADLTAAIHKPVIGQHMQHHRAEPALCALFNGDQRLVVAQQLPDQRVVQWFGETRIGHGGRHALHL